jgi:hypothetical protein
LLLYGAVVNKLKTVLPRLMNSSSAPVTFFAFEQPVKETEKFVNYGRIRPARVDYLGSARASALVHSKAETTGTTGVMAAIRPSMIDDDIQNDARMRATPACSARLN